MAFKKKEPVKPKLDDNIELIPQHRVTRQKQTVGTRRGKGSLIAMTKSEHLGMFKPPEDEQSVMLIANEWLKWSENPNSMVLQEYPLSKLWNPYHFYHLADKSEYFAQIQTIVKERIAARIEEQSRSGRSDKKIDISWVKEFLPEYSASYRKRKFDSMASRIEGLKSQSFQVIIPPILLPEDQD